MLFIKIYFLIKKRRKRKKIYIIRYALFIRKLICKYKLISNLYAYQHRETTGAIIKAL